MKIYKLKIINQSIVQDFERLIPQLSKKCIPPTGKELNSIIKLKAADLFCSRGKHQNYWFIIISVK
ncbi:hypothetical protein JL193_06865 [Polaribacter batillariae]|uniref:Uncharacterized protein n=1 Tax=Polaribacter batillariae TaxID=2808900 RepID=A0ABX7SYK5_9FLAO|nr:hypothetical protein [Polaribacter batillariae]QTD38967.1 hypothetical protein JL193_06865 [Polaribacter batillariae]